MHIEDQLFPKRCGHLGGKKLVETERMLSKLERAVSARNAIQSRGGDFMICARTDARSVTGLDDAIERAVAYFCGVDPLMNRGDAVAATYSAEASRGDAAAATWIFRGGESRLRRGRDVKIRSRRAHASGTPRPAPT